MAGISNSKKEKRRILHSTLLGLGHRFVFNSQRSGLRPFIHLTELTSHLELREYY